VTTPGPGSIEAARADSADHRYQLAMDLRLSLCHLAQRPRCQSVPRGGPQKPHKLLRRKAHHWKPTDGTGLNGTRRHSGYDGGISLLTSPYAGELGCVIVTRSWSQRGIEPPEKRKVGGSTPPLTTRFRSIGQPSHRGRHLSRRAHHRAGLPSVRPGAAHHGGDDRDHARPGRTGRGRGPRADRARRAPDHNRARWPWGSRRRPGHRGLARAAPHGCRHI
jgi:hypothetical protein